MKLYLKYAGIILRSQMQYKASFIMTAIGQFLVSFSLYLSIYFMFTRFNKVRDFSYYEVLLCFSIVLTAYAFTECFVRGFDAFSGIIANGEFDRIMVRPRNEIFQVLATRMEFTRIARFLQALLVCVYAIPESGINWTFDKYLTVLLMLLGGVAVFSGLFLVYASLCFFTLEGLEFINIFTDGGRDFGRYPLSVYGEGVLKFFTYVVPLALFQYYPLLYLIGRTDNMLFMLTPLLGVLFLIPCYCLWRVGVKHYNSTGS